MSVKGNLKKLASTYEITPTKKTVTGILGEIAEALGGSGNGKTVAEQIYNIALAKGYVEPSGDDDEGDEGDDTDVALIDCIIAECYETPTLPATILVTENLPTESVMRSINVGDTITVQIDGVVWYSTIVSHVSEPTDGVIEVYDSASEDAIMRLLREAIDSRTGETSPMFSVMASEVLSDFGRLPESAVPGKSICVIRTESQAKIFRFVSGEDPNSYEMDPHCDFNSISEFLTFCDEHADPDSGFITISDAYVSVRGDIPNVFWQSGMKFDDETFWTWHGIDMSTSDMIGSLSVDANGIVFEEGNK